MIISNLETDVAILKLIPGAYLELACDVQATLIQLLPHIWNRSKVFWFYAASKCGKNYPLGNILMLLRVWRKLFIKSLTEKK